MKALLSIKSEFVKRILSGEKKYEYRRRVFARDDVEAIVIYETLPVGRVVAEVEVEKVIKDTPSALWEETHKESGITEQFFFLIFLGLSKPVLLSSETSGFSITRFYCLNTIPI